MVRRIVALALVVTFASMAPSFAGEDHEDMMKQMMNCSVCSKMMPHLAELAPVMKAEIVELNNGMAMIHTITDAKKIASYHAVSEMMQAAGNECMTYTDAQAEGKLCGHCNEIRSAVQAGASMSVGITEHGDMMVLTSDKPELQKKIDGIQKNFEMLMAASR